MAAVLTIIADVDVPTNCVAVQNVPATSNVRIEFGIWDGSDAVSFVSAAGSGGGADITVIGNLVQRAFSNARNTDSQNLLLLECSTKVYDQAPGSASQHLEVLVDTVVQLNAYVNLSGVHERRVLREDLSAAVTNALNDNA